MRTDEFKQHLLAAAVATAVAAAGASGAPAPIQATCLAVEDKQRGKPAAAPIQPPCLLEGDTIVTYKDLAKEGITYSRVHMRRLIARGLFPAPVMLSPNRMGWGRKTHLEPWKTSRPTAPIKPEPGAPAEAA